MHGERRGHLHGRGWNLDNRWAMRYIVSDGVASRLVRAMSGLPRVRTLPEENDVTGLRQHGGRVLHRC